MALIGNGMRAGGNPCSFRFGTAYGVNRAAYHSTGQMNNAHFSSSRLDAGVIQSKQFGRPSGRRQPNSWNMGISGGAIASRTDSLSLSGSATGSEGLSPTAVTSTITLTGSALGQLISAGIATGTITLAGTATPAALLSAVATGTVTLTGAAVSKGTGTFTGTGAISLAGTVDSQGYGYIVATTEESGLTPTGIANAVWAALASSNNVAGTMGEKLNDAGSASNPWTEVIEDSMTAAEVLRVIASALAGTVSGAGTGTETFKGLDGTTDRIVSTVDNDGNRTSVTLDGT